MLALRSLVDGSAELASRRGPASRRAPGLAASLLASLLVACAANPPPAAPRPSLPLPSDAIDEPDESIVVPEPPPPEIVALPPVDLEEVPVVLPTRAGRARAPEECDGRYESASLIAPPRRLLDSAAGFGIDREGGRVVRFTPAQIDVLEGKAWRRVADLATRPPNGQAPFTQLLGGWIEDGVVVFRGDFDGQFGLFRWHRGELAALADRATTAPGSTAPFTELGLPALADGTVYFWGEAGGDRERATLYGVRDGRLDKPALAVRAMGGPLPRDGAVVFSGNSGATSAPQGIYALRGSVLELLVPPTAQAPDGAPLGPLILGDPSLYRRGLLFVTDAGGQGRRGLWLAESQQVRAIVDPHRTRIDERGRFFMVAAVGPFADDDVIVFQAHRADPGGELVYGLYALRGCALFRITEAGDALDGKTVSGVAHMYAQAVGRGLVIYPVVFTDGSQATYAVRLR